MFDIPEVKRVKRSDFLNQDEEEEGKSLLDATRDSGEDEAAHESVNYGFEYDFVSSSLPQKDTQAAPSEQDDQSYEFRLFAPAPKPATSQATTAIEKSTSTRPASRITLLRSPSPSSTPTTQEGRLLRPRPDSHYLATSTPELRLKYSSSAISTSAILTLACTPWPGTSIPWRVTHRPAESSPRSKPTTTTQPTQSPPPQSPAAKPTTRTKPNKKRRILLRRRLAARTALLAKSQPKPTAKPPIIRSETGEILDLAPEERKKRSTRNREKKLKRRQKDRERKAALAGSAGGDGAEKVVEGEDKEEDDSDE